MSSPDVIVVGAGVLGLCVAAELGARGRAVTVVDPGGPNASSVAAGMLAPAFESVLEDAGQDRADLLRRARDLWPVFADRHHLTVDDCGAEWRGADGETVARKLVSLGFSAEVGPGGVASPDDWRIDVATALEALRQAPGVTACPAFISRISRSPESWRVEARDGGAWTAGAVVLATGAAQPLEGMPESVRRLMSLIQPIRGQITAVACETPARVLRSARGYVVPTSDGVLSGATMEPGVRDLSPDAETTASQIALARSLVDRVQEDGSPRVGVRGATADGLPMAGASGTSGLFLALAPRRNGWLLGPLVGRTVADAFEGRASGADARALDPLRFA